MSLDKKNTIQVPKIQPTSNQPTTNYTGNVYSSMKFTHTHTRVHIDTLFLFVYVCAQLTYKGNINNCSVIVNKIIYSDEDKIIDIHSNT